VARQLKASELSRNFGTEALESLAARAQVMELPAGRYVFRKGDASDELYLLARGAAYVLSAESGSGEEVVNQLGSGTVFGEIAMLGGERRSASVRTAAASTLVRIPRAALAAAAGGGRGAAARRVEHLRGAALRRPGAGDEPLRTPGPQGAAGVAAARQAGGAGAEAGVRAGAGLDGHHAR